MIEARARRLLVDGRPTLVMSGEVHYFRLPRDQWADRVAKAKEIGYTAVASYIPWLWHETADGDIDVTGRTRPERDVGACVALCHEQGLWFVARRGPSSWRS